MSPLQTLLYICNTLTRTPRQGLRHHPSCPTPLQDLAAQDSLAGDAGAAGGNVGRFRALVDTIIGNLELKISNIHIRYEDSTSNPGHSFCIGVLLSEISAHTVGEDWQRKFVTADALLTLRKVRVMGVGAAHAAAYSMPSTLHLWQLLNCCRRI